LPLLLIEDDCGNIDDYDAVLLVGDKGLSVQRTGARAPGPVTVDFGSADMRHRRRGGHNELLGRAVGIGRKPRLHVLDATAGLGRDSFVLADLGCDVLMCEREPLVAALLASGLEQGRASGDTWLQGVLARMRLWPGDARLLPAREIDAHDAIYLDPMFPARGKSAAAKKEMALFQLLLAGRADDAVALLAWSLQQDVSRVVVKRPAKAQNLGGRRPSHVIAGRSVRYDVYVRRALV
jgi:16S rRNA (guanine1516-N2)-methyltransferase